MRHEPYPDLEIYIQHVDVDLLIHWMGSLFTLDTDPRSIDGSQFKNGQSIELSLELSLNKGDMQLVIVPNAVKKKFTSLWIKPNHTQWDTDKDLALAALAQFGTEIRCSRGSWNEDGSTEHAPDAQDEKSGWLRFTPKGEFIVNWLTE